MTAVRCLAVITLQGDSPTGPAQAAPLARHEDLGLCFANDRMMIWAARHAEPLTLANDMGIILGTVFEGLFPAKPITHFDDRRAGEIVASSGHSLNRKAWGAFVAFLSIAQNRHVRVVRDASSSCPVYYCVIGSHLLVATQVRDLQFAGLERPEIDLSYLAGHLQLRGYRSRRTALRGISELMPGEHLRVEDGRIIREEGWSPWTFACKSRELQDPVQAAELLKDTVKATVQTWSGVYKHAILGVSGGLDSSIVAILLRDAAVDLSLFNLLSSQDSQGDERYYARSLGTALGLDVHVVQECISHIDIARSDAAHLPRPEARAFSQSSAYNLEALARECGANVVFSGGGGDNVFCYLQSSAPVTDRILSGHGVGKILATARDISQITGAPFATVLRTALKRIAKRQARYLWSPDVSFLTPEFQHPQFNVQDHPWIAPLSDRLPGKLEHVALLVIVSNFLEGFAYERRLPVVYPLLSQPVVELCLTIPTWMWCAGGKNRAVAREAFRDRLPGEIFSRATKGSFDRFAIELLDSHHERVREFLCDGFLSQSGLLNASSVSEELNSLRSRQDLTWARILSLVDVEAWCRSWR